jgi:hypothetical protein
MFLNSNTSEWSWSDAEYWDSERIAGDENQKPW